MIILYGSGEIASLDRWEAYTQCVPVLEQKLEDRVVVAGNPRELSDIISGSNSTEMNSTETYYIVPLTCGLDLHSVTQAAQMAQWLATTGHSVSITEPVLSSTEVVAAMRQGIKTASQQGHDSLIFVARHVDPFADADVVYRARLAWQFNDGLESVVAFEGSRPDVPTVAHRLNALEYLSSAVSRADIDAPGVGQSALLAPGALIQAMVTRMHSAQHLLSHGETGIAEALLADHAQGFAHSHGHDEDHGHSHTHTHTHTH